MLAGIVVEDFAVTPRPAQAGRPDTKHERSAALWTAGQSLRCHQRDQATGRPEQYFKSRCSLLRFKL